MTDNRIHCWVCDRHIYSLLFWNPEIGWLKDLKLKNEQIVLRTIKPLEFETKRPVLYCFNNNWQGQEMHTVSEFCFMIDDRKPLSLNKFSVRDVTTMQQSGIEPKLSTPKKNRQGQETDSQKKILEVQLYQQIQKYKNPDVFREVMNQNLEFRDP